MPSLLVALIVVFVLAFCFYESVLPDRSPVPSPAECLVSKQPKKERTPKDKTPDNVSYVSGIPYQEVEEKGSDIAFDLYDGSGTRTKDFTQFDAEIVETNGFHEGRYREMKAFWATGVSAAKLERMFPGRYGFKERTIDNYFAGMARANVRANKQAKAPR